MTTQTLSFRQTAAFSALALDYVENSDKFSAFIDAPFSREGIAMAIRHKSVYFKADMRQRLVSAIKQQYATGEYQLPSAQIERFLDANTFSVCTAHQPNLMGGPAYWVYKIAGAIALANRLNTESSRHFIPVYWMGAEDHDLDELNHLFVFSQRLSWESGQTGAVGRMQLQQLEGLLAQLEQILGNSMHANDLMRLISSCFKPEYTLARAIRMLADGLFGTYGLVVLDGDDAALKSAFTPVVLDELTHGATEALVNQSAQSLEALGYKAQIFPREINLFWLEEQMRARIVRQTAGGYATADGSKQWTESEMFDLTRQQPAAFSPNVVLRPVYQEIVLPNVAFIGGGAEVAYWMLLKPVFERYGVPMPVIMLRSSVLCLDKGSVSKMHKLNISLPQLFEEEQVLMRTFIQTHESTVFVIDEIQQQLEALYEATAEQIAQVDESLHAASLAEGKKALAALKGLEARARKSQKQKHETELNQIAALKQKLFPERHLQERHDSFMNFYLQHGQDFIAHCVQELDPLRKLFFVFS